MDAAERKRLIAKGDENKKIAEAIAEEKRIILSKPVQKMPTDSRLANLPKHSYVDKTGKKIIGASEIIRIRKENMAKGLATINEEIVPDMEAAKKTAQEHPKVEEGDPIKDGRTTKEEKPKAKPRRGRSKKVE